MPDFRIEAYVYSEGPRGSAGVAAGAAAALQTVQTIAVIESGTPATTTYERPATPLLFTDLLALWAADLTQAAPWGAPAGTYACAYDQATRRVTLSSTNATAFKPVGVGFALEFVGITQGIGGYALSWTGVSVPFGVAELQGVLVEPAEDWTIVELERYRHGRAVAAAWGNHQVHRVQLLALGDARAALAGGYLTTGRVRIYQGDTVTPYSPTNVDGYVDGWVIAAGDLEVVGDDEDLWVLDLLVAVPR